MKLGLIGGIGPQATADYYLKLVQRLPPPAQITIVHADINQLLTNASTDDRLAQAKIYASHLQELKNSGCSLGVITSLTGHFCWQETANIAPLPIDNAMQALSKHAQRKGIQRLGLLGSGMVLTSKLFGMLNGVELIVPSRATEVGDAYLSMAKAGACSEAQQALFFEQGARMVKDEGVDAVLLAGTDLSLAFDGQDPGFPVMDALEVHVQSLVEKVKAA